MDNNEALLNVNDLRLELDTIKGKIELLHGVSLRVYPGEILAIVGESGSGKTMLCKSIVGILPREIKITNGFIEKDDLRISMVFQNPMTSLNPTMTIGEQIAEGIRLNQKGLSDKEVRAEVIRLMNLVGIEQCEKRYDSYPHQFSGGMKQRCVIAIAIACKPDLLIADEPTTALDATIQLQILDLLMKIKDMLGISILFITHDIGVVAKIADRVVVMKDGQIQEVNDVMEIFYNPQNRYTKDLLKFSTNLTFDNNEKNNNEKSSKDVLLSLENVARYFSDGNHLLVKSVDGLNLSIYKGELFGIVGESGSGKSTLGKCVLAVYSLTNGKILYDGNELSNKIVADKVQAVFQDSTSALNPHMTVKEIIEEPLMIKGLHKNKKERLNYIISQLERVELGEEVLYKKPKQLSGGERQRVSVARAICTDPELLLADEPIASLDVVTQVKLSNLFLHLQKKHKFTTIFISHNLAMVKAISNRVAVMYKGRIVELGPTEKVYSNPAHPYTKELLSSMLVADPIIQRSKTKVLHWDGQKDFSNSRYEEVELDHFVLREVEWDEN